MAKTKKDPNEMSFLDHLEELRWHLIRSTMVIVALGFVAFLMREFIFDTIIFGPKILIFPPTRSFANSPGWLVSVKLFAIPNLYSGSRAG